MTMTPERLAEIREMVVHTELLAALDAATERAERAEAALAEWAAYDGKHYGGVRHYVAALEEEQRKAVVREQDDAEARDTARDTAEAALAEVCGAVAIVSPGDGDAEVVAVLAAICVPAIIGPVDACATCGFFECVCTINVTHAEPCMYRKAMNMWIDLGLCDHGVDVCPECFPCTCGVGR